MLSSSRFAKTFLYEREAECSIKLVVHKLKPRKTQLFRKADWTKFKLLMKDFQQSFLSGHKGKTIDKLLKSFSSALENFSEQCIPNRLIKSKPSSPWVTQQIKRLIRKRDHLYHKLKKKIWRPANTV